MAYKRKWTEEQKEKRRVRDKARRLRLKDCPEYKEKVNTQAKTWRANNKEKVNASAKKYREENLEKSKSRDKAWRESNKERVKENVKRHHLENKSSFRYYLTRVWAAQRGNSKQREHEMPTYTKAWLGEWIQAQPNFQTLFDKYIESGFNKFTRPSIDRIDNNKGYTEDNIQLMTWGENLKKK